MLYRVPVQQLRSKNISKKYGYLVVAMQFYPRFVTKELIHEYCHALAPDRVLFTEFKKLEREIKDHNRAFDLIEYEKRFSLSPIGRTHLERLSTLAKEQNVYLICQCSPLQKCHTDLLLLMAQKWFGSRVQWARIKYPEFEKRLSEC